MAKNVFNEIGANYKVIELDQHNDGKRLQEALAQLTGVRTVRVLDLNVRLLMNSLFEFSNLKKKLYIYLFQPHIRPKLFIIIIQLFKITHSGRF